MQSFLWVNFKLFNLDYTQFVSEGVEMATQQESDDILSEM